MRFIEQESKVYYFKNPSTKGIFSNLNNAITRSSGEYVQIFCQDDLMYPHMLSAQVQGLQQHPESGMIFCGRDLIDDTGHLFKKGPRNKRQYAFNTPTHSLNKYLSRGCIPGNISPVMLRRGALEKTGSFNPGMKYSGDFEYWVRLSLAGYGYVYHPDSLLSVRKHAEQASNRLTKAVLLEEHAQVYRILLAHHTAARSDFYCRLYVNQTVGMMHLRKLARSGELATHWRLLNRRPFQLLSIMLLLMLTLNGKWKLLKIEEGRDF